MYHVSPQYFLAEVMQQFHAQTRVRYGSDYDRAIAAMERHIRKGWLSLHHENDETTARLAARGAARRVALVGVKAL